VMYFLCYAGTCVSACFEYLPWVLELVWCVTLVSCYLTYGAYNKLRVEYVVFLLTVA